MYEFRFRCDYERVGRTLQDMQSFIETNCSKYYVSNEVSGDVHKKHVHAVLQSTKTRKQLMDNLKYWFKIKGLSGVYEIKQYDDSNDKFLTYMSKDKQVVMNNLFSKDDEEYYKTKGNQIKQKVECKKQKASKSLGKQIVDYIEATNKANTDYYKVTTPGIYREQIIKAMRDYVYKEVHKSPSPSPLKGAYLYVLNYYHEDYCQKLLLRITSENNF